MNILRLKNYQFKFKPLATIFFLVVFSLLLWLAHWQLQRAEEKQRLLQQYQSMLMQPIIEITKPSDWQRVQLFQMVRLRGVYDNQHQFLLDNRFAKHQVGYEVLTPLRSGNQVVMVNRGWIPRTPSRQQLPEITAVTGEQVVVGRVDTLTHSWFTLGQVEENPQQWPRVLQTMDIKTLAKALNYAALPAVVIQLAPEQSYGFVRDWQPVVIKPEKHKGYAIQWLLLAIVQLIVLVRYNFQRINK